MRLLIVEPDADGHHMVLYTRLLLKEAASRGWSVTVLTTTSSLKHDAFAVISADHNGELRTITMPEVSRTKANTVSLMVSQLRLWNGFAKAFRSNDNFSKFDLIYCVNLDYFEKALSLCGSPFGDRPFAGMFMNPKFHRAPKELGPSSRADFLYRILFKRLLAIAGLKRLMVIDGPFQEYCLQEHFTHAKKMCLVPDVGELSGFESTSAARASLGLASDAFVILLYGSVSLRKGLEHLLRAVQNQSSCNVVVLVAGKPDAACAELLASPRCRALQESGRLLVRAEFQDDESEAKVFGAADVVWLGYVGGAYGSSGVLYQAGFAGLPVISMADGLVGWTVKKHELGIALDPTDTGAVVNAIGRLQRDEPLLRELGENGRCIAKRHTGTAFSKTICDALATTISDDAGNAPATADDKQSLRLFTRES